NKFGVAIGHAGAVYDRAAKMDNIEIVGVQMHIGSQITEAVPFADAIRKVSPLVRELQAKYRLQFFSIGGGLGIVYESSFASGASEWWDGKNTRLRPTTARQGSKRKSKDEDESKKRPLSIHQYVDAILPPLRELGLRVLLEPGRLLVGNAGVLLTRVRYVKRTGQKKFAIVDAGMNDLIRPALYHSYHEIVPVEKPSCRVSVSDAAVTSKSPRLAAARREHK